MIITKEAVKDSAANLALFFLIILCISLVFAALYRFIPFATFNKGDEVVNLTFFESLYFSIVTITTLGYGDISPCSVTSKVLSALEPIFGLFLVGWSINTTWAKKERNEQRRKTLEIYKPLINGVFQDSCHY